MPPPIAKPVTARHGADLDVRPHLAGLHERPRRLHDGERFRQHTRRQPAACARRAPTRSAPRAARATARPPRRRASRSWPACGGVTRSSRPGDIDMSHVRIPSGVFSFATRAAAYDIADDLAERPATAAPRHARFCSRGKQRKHQFGEAVRLFEMRIAGENERIDAERRVLLHARRDLSPDCRPAPCPRRRARDRRPPTDCG